MKKLLIFPFDILAHYVRCIELTKLYKESYEISFLYSPSYNHLVEKAGFKSFNCKTFCGKSVIKKAERFDFSWLNQHDIADISIEQYRAIIQHQPDLVLGDTMPTLKIACELTGVKYRSLLNAYMTNYYQPTRKLSRAHFAYPLFCLLPENFRNKAVSFFEALKMEDVHQPFKLIREELGLQEVDDFLSELEGDENLICDDIDIFKTLGLPSNFEVIGPLVTKNEDQDDVLNEINPSKKTIAVCIGSYGNWKKLKWLESGEYNRYNIVVCGTNAHQLEADHIISKNWINLDIVLPQTSLFICHAGNGTVYKAIEHGCKMLFCTNHFEQEWNAQSFEAAGFGLDISEYAEEEVLAQIETMLEIYEPVTANLKYNLNNHNALWI